MLPSVLEEKLLEKKWNVYDYHGKGFDILYKKLFREGEPNLFRENLFSLIQVYSKHLYSSPGDWGEQKFLLDGLYSAGEAFVECYYDDVHDFEVSKELVPEDLKKVDVRGESHLRHLSGKDDFMDAYREFLKRAIHCEGLSFDFLAGVDTGGCEPLCIAMDCFGVQDFLPVRFSNRVGDEKPKTPVSADEDYVRHCFEGKSVLVLEDWVASGESLLEVMRLAESMGAERVVGSAPFYNPDFLKKDFVLLSDRPFLATI